MSATDLLIENARVVTCSGRGRTDAARLGVLEKSAVAISGERITWVGPSAAAKKKRAKARIDAAGGVLLPGLIDCHTHLAFAGSRVDEFARKMAGESYQRIAKSGGGIAATVKATRAASDEDLFSLTGRRAHAMRALGTTTVEVKSGYGLSLRAELRLLQVGRALESEGILRTTTTFLGLHAVPAEYAKDRAEYVAEVAGPMLDAVAGNQLADAVDAYLDEGAFTVAEGRTVLGRARALGLRVKAHAGQWKDIGAAELVAELGGLSADHLERVSDKGLKAMAKAGVVGVLLPGAWSTLRDTPPEAERFRRAGVAMAVATDANPGTSPCLDLPLAAALAVRDAGLTAEEALLAVTVNAAAALGLADRGRIAEGLLADLVLYDHDDPRVLAYALGGVRPRHVLLGGQVVDGDEASPVW